MFFNKLTITPVLLLLGIIAISQTALAADADDLTAMLHEFLAGADDAAAHERFWADDLVYTSSDGTRTTKAEIMQGFRASDSDESQESVPVYTAEDIQVKLYGSTAVVAFKLVATPGDALSLSGSDSVPLHYFNTGTFVKRNGRWQVVAWQATKIPGDS